jgi:ABC-2 type transport system permease protein
MTLRRALFILRKDLRLGPRSPFFLFVFVWPVLLTMAIQLIFGDLFAGAPRLAVYDAGDSEVTRLLEQRDGIELTHAASEEELWRLVDDAAVDMGWHLPAGFDDQLRTGEHPLMDIRISGQSYASTRIMLQLAAVEAVRETTADMPSVEIDLITFGEAAHLSLVQRMIPLMVLLAMIIGGIFLPAFSLTDEKQKGGMTALLVSPATIGDVLFAKGILGFAIAILSGAVTLALNSAFPSNPWPILLVLVIAAIMTVELGLALGVMMRNVSQLYTVWKSTAWFLALPVIPFLWEGFPEWIAMLSPTYYFITPAWELTLGGGDLSDVAWMLAVAVAIIVALVPILRWAGSDDRVVLSSA